LKLERVYGLQLFIFVVTSELHKLLTYDSISIVGCLSIKKQVYRPIALSLFTARIS